MFARSNFHLKSRDYIHTPEGKRIFNERHFSEAAHRYDVATRAMSLGRDRSWKRRLVEALPDMDEPACLDLACGTGDITELLAAKYPHGRILGLDLTEAMLALARERRTTERIQYIEGDMSETGLSSESLDVITGSYAVRNAPDLEKTLREIHRLLKPGGTAALLDFSKPAAHWYQVLQYAVLKSWCGFWGLLLHGSPDMHSYIAASLKTYPDRDRLHRLLARCGLSITNAQRYYFGTLELLVVTKTGDGRKSGD